MSLLSQGSFFATSGKKGIIYGHEWGKNCIFKTISNRPFFLKLLRIKIVRYAHEDAVCRVWVDCCLELNKNLPAPSPSLSLSPFLPNAELYNPPSPPGPGKCSFNELVNAFYQTLDSQQRRIYPVSSSWFIFLISYLFIIL